jgi:methionine-rich copper-binding protein CopC
MVGSTVDGSPHEVAITFDSPIEELFAKVEVSDASGRDETKGLPKVGADHRQVSVPLKPLKAGDYTVKWSVVAEDSHRTEGSFQFTVAGGSP